jgi:hypothetical protein
MVNKPFRDQPLRPFAEAPEARDGLVHSRVCKKPRPVLGRWRGAAEVLAAFDESRRWPCTHPASFTQTGWQKGTGSESGSLRRAR